MIAAFELFRKDPDGRMLLIGVSKTLKEAEQKIAQADKEIPATYVIVSVRTGYQIVVRSQRSDEGWVNSRSAFA